jgi:hypothetical protein
MLSLTLALTLQLPNKPVEYDILRNDVKIGTAKVFIKLTQTGGKKVETKLTITQASGDIKMLSAQEWDFEAMPILKTLQVFGTDGKESKRVRVDFKDSKAMVKNYLDGKEEASTVDAPEDAVLNDLAEFWLVRDEPEPKQKEEVFTFDINTFKWQKCEVRYMGEQVKTFGEKKIRLHHIRRKTETRTDDIWTEGSGLLYYSESSDGTILKRTVTEE